MKLFAYALREYDELGYMRECVDELGFEFGWTDEYPTLDNVELAAGASALCIITNPMTPELLDAYHALGIRAIATRSIGYDHIDVAHARKLGMRIAAAAYPPEGVAEYTIMLMLMALRRMKLIDLQNAAQDFGLRGKIGRELSSCTVGVIGTGRIGTTVVRQLAGFGCRILACDPAEKPAVRELARYVTLDELLREADIVTLHPPGLACNHHLIGERELGLMKADAILINAARGMLVDSEALICALEQGRLGGAALDTVENEVGLYYLDRSGDALANRERAILSSFPNVIVTPHMAFYTARDVRYMVRTDVEALLAFERGEDSPYEVLV